MGRIVAFFCVLFATFGAILAFGCIYMGDVWLGLTMLLLVYMSLAVAASVYEKHYFIHGRRKKNNASRH